MIFFFKGKIAHLIFCLTPFTGFLLALGWDIESSDVESWVWPLRHQPVSLISSPTGHSDLSGSWKAKCHLNSGLPHVLSVEKHSPEGHLSHERGNTGCVYWTQEMLGKKNKHSWNKEEGMAEYERFGNSWSEKSQDHLGSSATEQGASLDPAA